MFNSSTQENLYNQLKQIIVDNENRGIITATLKEASKDDLLKILTVNIPKESLSDRERTLTLTLLGFAIYNNNQEDIKAILDAAKEQNILKDVLTTASIIMKLRNGKECTFTPLGFTIYFNNQEGIKAILDAAENHGILKEVFAATKEDDHERIKTILREAGEHDILTKILQVETSISTNKAMKIGVTLCVITALTIGTGCFAANVELSMLVIASIAVAAALAVGIVADGIAYAV